jgi:hypothetical protein
VLFARNQPNLWIILLLVLPLQMPWELLRNARFLGCRLLTQTGPGQFVVGVEFTRHAAEVLLFGERVHFAWMISAQSAIELVTKPSATPVREDKPQQCQLLMMPVKLSPSYPENVGIQPVLIMLLLPALLASILLPIPLLWSLL